MSDVPETGIIRLDRRSDTCPFLFASIMPIPMRVALSITQPICHSAERARTEMMRLLGIDLLRLQREEDRLFAVRNCTIDYRPSRPFQRST